MNYARSRTRYLLIAIAILGHAQALWAQDCYESSIKSPSPFMRNDDEIFVLTDGTMWQVKYEYEYMYEYYPSVVICPSLGKLLIDGKSLNVQQVGGLALSVQSQTPQPTEVPDFIESSIDGDFEGWEGETVVKLMNGQDWQQSEYYYHYHYSYGARVRIFRVDGQYKMQVEGIDKAVGVRRLK